MNSTQDDFEDFMVFASDKLRYRSILRNAFSAYSIEQLKLETISPESIRDVLKSQEKTSPDNEEKNREDLDHWRHFQLKAFSWVAICYSSMKNKSFPEFDDEDMAFFMRLFPSKCREFIMFHLRSLIKLDRETRKKWSQQENDLLLQIMREFGDSLQWSQASYMMFVRSGCTIFKAREKCREQWTNHLFPGLRKGSWSKQEDLQLFQTVKEYGKKWSVISKLFKGARSEHMVKNRYNSLIHKTKKKWHQGSQQDWEERSIKLLQKAIKRQKSKKKVFEEEEQKMEQVRSEVQVNIEEDAEKRVMNPTEGFFLEGHDAFRFRFEVRWQSQSMQELLFQDEYSNIKEEHYLPFLL